MKLLLRYDVEATEAVEMRGFLAKMVDVHRRHRIPITCFCTGSAIDARAEEFRAFASAVDGDPLFDIQDHSYTHIGIGYEAGNPIEVLREDYERSFAAHERVIGKRPIGISICGTGCDGARLRGFDATPKARAELAMLAGLGVRMVNTLLVERAEAHDFIDYATLGLPEVMGFPSANSDTSWMYRRPRPEALATVMDIIDDAAKRRENLSLIMHDWLVWKFAGDRLLSHVVLIAEHARRRCYEIATHRQCYDQLALWRSASRTEAMA